MIGLVAFVLSLIFFIFVLIYIVKDIREVRKDFQKGVDELNSDLYKYRDMYNKYFREKEFFPFKED